MSFPQWRQWAGDTAVILASGPSMTPEDAAFVRGKARVITVNTTFRLAQWADVHYSSDHDWWSAHWEEMDQVCQGQRWTAHPTFTRPGLMRCPWDKNARGLSRRVGVIAWGGNSGYCAVGLAHQFGAAKIVLLGFDMCDPDGTGHWHGQHPAHIRKDFNWPMWHARFAELAADCRRLGIRVINSSRRTALTCFDTRALERTL